MTFIEKFGALILSKSKKQEANWWILEKVPAILMRRLSFPLPQLEACADYYGDTAHLRPRETMENFITWPQLRTDMWTKHDARGPKGSGRALVFKLSAKHFEERREDILNDLDILKVIGPTEILLELTNSRTMGHHVAILLNILSDHAGGTSYLANPLRKAVELIERRCVLSGTADRKEVSQEIHNWLKGLGEKAWLLVEKRDKLLSHMNTTVKRLTQQRRGEVAAQLVQSVPFPQDNRIIPAFRSVSSVVSRLDRAMEAEEGGELNRIHREIVVHRTIPAEGDSKESTFRHIRLAVNRWLAALSGQFQDNEVYMEARLSVAEGEAYRMYIVAYDLIGSSGPLYAGPEGARRDRQIQSIIANWFIAFGGYVQRAEFGAGDLGYGFFHSPHCAVQASLWASYHLELLKGTNPLLRQDKPHAGFGIVPDDLLPGYMEQVKSGWLGKFARAWKCEAERVADNAGRLGRPIVAVKDDMFSGVRELPANWFGDSGKLDKILVRYMKPEAMSALPWKSDS